MGRALIGGSAIATAVLLVGAGPTGAAAAEPSQAKTSCDSIKLGEVRVFYKHNMRCSKAKHYARRLYKTDGRDEPRKFSCESGSNFNEGGGCRHDSKNKHFGWHPLDKHKGSRKPKVLCWNNDYPEPVGNGHAEVKVRPSKCGFFKRGEASNAGAVRVVRLAWKRWGNRKATGEGVAVANMGARVSVAVKLSKPVRNCAGKQMFSKAAFRFDGRSTDFKLYSCPNKRFGRDMPGTDGGPAEKGCRPVLEQTHYVGATNMACSNARRVAKRAIRGNAQRRKWKCTGVGATFGHCHGRGRRDGKTVHWAVND